jgi:hypothetical protein
VGGVRRLAFGLLLAAGLAACGGRERTPALPPVHLVLSAPGDLSSVDAHTVTVRGTVVPAGARVLVQGREAEVRDGRFSAEVDLVGGANVIDVEAAAPRRPAAMTAVRVTRLVPVRVPDVEGYPPDDAVDALEAVGLRADVKETGFLDDILPGSPGVCSTDPPAGDKVRVGTTVAVAVQKSC